MKTQYINAKIKNEITSFIVEDAVFHSFGEIDKSLPTVDVEGNLVLPGFFDTHLHLVGLGYNKSITSLQGLDVDKIVSELKQVNKDWIIGRGWHQNAFSRTLSKKDLDEVSTDRPVIAIRVCGHVLIANSKAIELTGLTTEEYKGGTISFETGEFTEDALEAIYSLIPDNDKEAIKNMILLSQEDMLQNGITSVGSDDFSMLKVEYQDVIDAYQELDEAGLLKLRVIQQVNLPDLNDFNEFISKGYANKQVGSKIKMGPMKLLLDGSLGGQTAYMNEPYEGTDNVGVNTFTQNELNEMISICEAADMDFSIHAIGDGAVDLILNAPKTRKTHGIIHAQFLNQRQIKECKEQGISIYAQPIFLNSDIPIIEKFVGDRAKESYLFKTMNDELLLSFSTDAPVEDINPFENIEVAMTRQMLNGSEVFLQEESFTFDEAIKCYSENGHLQVGISDNGRLESGYLADFVIVRQAEDVKNFEILSTYIDGELVYTK